VVDKTIFELISWILVFDEDMDDGCLVEDKKLGIVGEYKDEHIMML